MTTPVELRALAQKIENGETPYTWDGPDALRSAADRIEELELEVHALALMEKALEQAKRQAEGQCDGCGAELSDAYCVLCLEQAKREENEACVKVIESNRFTHEIDMELYHDSGGGRMCARCGEQAYEEGQPCSPDETNERINAIVAAIRSRYPAQAQGEKDETK